MEENKPATNISKEKKYAGKHWFNINTIAVILTILSFVIIVCYKPLENMIPLIVTVVLITGLSYMSLALKMNYFIVKDETLFIKNHFSLSEHTSIPMVDIAAFEIIRPYKSSKTLKVYTTNGGIRLFTAGSLNKRDWDEFKKDMIADGFTVRDVGSLF